MGAFIEPFNVRKFVSAYISVSPYLPVTSSPAESTDVTCPSSRLTAYGSVKLPTFLLLILGYNLRKHGLRFSDWWTDKSADLSNTVQATSLKRKGRLEFPDNGFTRENVLTFLEWIWVWTK